MTEKLLSILRNTKTGKKIRMSTLYIKKISIKQLKVERKKRRKNVFIFYLKTRKQMKDNFKKK